jgi:hypothetical protein
MTHDYSLRGKCKQMAEAAVAADPALTLMTGHYYCPHWGQQEHWWTVRAGGTVYDPTAAQFPSMGRGIYEPWDGTFECAECAKSLTRQEVGSAEGRYAFCSGRCHGRFVGVFA